MADIDEELEEIKKLIGADYSDTKDEAPRSGDIGEKTPGFAARTQIPAESPAGDATGHAGDRPAPKKEVLYPVTQRQSRPAPRHGQLYNPSSPRQQPRQTPAPRADQQQTSAPQLRRPDAPPAARPKPGAPQPGQNTGTPAAQQQLSAPQSRQATGLPATRQQLIAQQSRQVSGPPAVRQQPGTPQKRQQPGMLDTPPRPRPPQPGQVPNAPATLQNRAPQSRRSHSALPPGSGHDERIQSYDISPDGKVTKHRDKELSLDTGTENFKVNFDFDEAYKNVPENRPLRLRREKRTGLVNGLLYAAFVICVSLVLASLMWMAAVDVLGFSAEDEEVNFTVPVDFTIEDITERLHDAGMIRYKALFSIYAGFSNAEDKISAGTYVLNKNFDYRAIVQGMTARAGVRKETTVTIPEGFTLSQIFSLLEEHHVCSAENLWDAAANYDFDYHFLDKETLGNRLRLEGFLFPETYNFYENSTAVQAINRFLREFDKRFSDDYIARAEELGYSIQDILNVAAMIEREAGSDEERPRIAAVIYNRLNNPKDYPMLQIDATIFYAISLTGSSFSLELDNPYNTYLHEGLPPGPIANPGMQSIRAALYPDSTNEYFYALNKEGTHNFFRTRSEHERFVQSDGYGGNR